MAIEIRTQRLLLRQWSSADLDPFADMNADPRVMEYFPSLLSREESDAAVGRIRAHSNVMALASGPQRFPMWLLSSDLWG